MLSHFSHVQLCDPVDYSPPASSVCGILQARILEWVSMLSSRGSSWPRDWTCVSYVSCTGTWVLYHVWFAGKSLQSCPTLCDSIEGSPPCFPVPGILQARILEWVAISFSKAWKGKVKVKLLSCVRLLATPWTPPWGGVPLPSPMCGLRSTKTVFWVHLFLIEG